MNLFIPEHLLVFLRSAVQREVRRPRRQHQTERIACLRLTFHECAGVVRLREGIVIGPVFGRLVADPEIASGRGVAKWFNTDPFRAPAPFRLGTSPTSVLRGPGVVNV